jgi:ArsR family transcriptional regulator
VPPALPQARSDRLAEIFRAAGDPTRLQMLYMLQEASDPICVCDFTQAFGVRQPTVSHHLAKLRDAGLVEAEHHGIWTYYTLGPGLPPEVRALLEGVRA